ncbi:MAG: hypothetical protein NZM04_06370 [Methylacidiphilales bacterium]|nr:hypothetical protein [Candidatus Methylacidiphilales bacterium]
MPTPNPPSPSSPAKNLDILCADTGQKIASIPHITQKTLQDALTVLADQGLYALFLFIEAKYKEIHEKFNKHALELLTPGIPSRSSQNSSRTPPPRQALDAAKLLAQSPHSLLLATHLLNQALIYARYHLKAQQPPSESNSSSPQPNPPSSQSKK